MLAGPVFHALESVAGAGTCWSRLFVALSGYRFSEDSSCRCFGPAGLLGAGGVYSVAEGVGRRTRPAGTVPRAHHTAATAGGLRGKGPLAGWAYRNLQHDADEVVVAETRRNAYVAKDGDKSDPIDALKLAQLDRGGFIRPVHHHADTRLALFKDLVLFYRKCANQRIARANRLIWSVRGEGVMVREKDFSKDSDREEMLAALPRNRMLAMRVQMLLQDYDQAVEHESRAHQELVRRAKKTEVTRRSEALPGIGWIRAATFYALIDTPFRFHKKSALWRYMGIGLQRRGSGNGKEVVKTSPVCNHHLKDIILSAAHDAARMRKDNPFQQQYRRCIEHGLVPRVARRTIARSMATTMGGITPVNPTAGPPNGPEARSSRTTKDAP